MTSDEYLEKEALDESLANTRSIATVQTVAALVETLNDAVEKLQENDEKRVFYDKDLGKTISEALQKVSTSLSDVAKSNGFHEIRRQHESFIKANEQNQRAFTALIAEISAQNKQLLSAVTTDNDHDIVLAINESNALIAKGLKQVDYTNVLESISKRPSEWKFDVVYRDGPNNRVDHIIAKAKI